MTTDTSPHRAFTCEPAENGGWIVREISSNYEMSRVLGAFSSPVDMLTYLRETLSPEPEIEALGAGQIVEIPAYAFDTFLTAAELSTRYNVSTGAIYGWRHHPTFPNPVEGEGTLKWRLSDIMRHDAAHGISADTPRRAMRDDAYPRQPFPIS